MSPQAPTPNTTGQQTSKAPNAYRILIRESLSKLVSEGTAQLYDDVCKQMDSDPPFVAKTHIVGHLLREIESSLRGVLRPLTTISEELCEECNKPISGEKCSCGRPKGLLTHKKEIDAILASLEVDEKSDLRKAWHDYAEKSHKYAHRDGLESPRPADTEFIDFHSQIEAVLVGVLDQFQGKYANVLNKLDELIAVTDPGNREVTTLRSNFTNNQMIRQYFFDRCKNEKWLPLLRSKEFFKKIPDPIYSADGGLYFPPWPPSAYLRYMVSIKPTEIKDILLEIEDTKNEPAKDVLLEIATALPEGDRLLLTEQIKKWL